MAGSNNIVFWILIIILLGTVQSCNTKYNSTIKYGEEVMERDFLKKDLVSHFPDKIKDKVVTMWLAPPACLPTYECQAQFGDMYLVCKTNSPKQIMLDSVLYKTEYRLDTNIIISLLDLKEDVLCVDKCNKWHAKRYPIPYFETYDFGLGDKDTIKKEINGVVHVRYTYNIPSDLQVYVVQAEAGDFWKVSCGEYRPNSLKEWEHGYSKGIAVSKKDDLIVYWVMIW